LIPIDHAKGGQPSDLTAQQNIPDHIELFHQARRSPRSLISKIIIVHKWIAGVELIDGAGDLVDRFNAHFLGLEAAREPLWNTIHI
jgi:hypothetical protein